MSPVYHLDRPEDRLAIAIDLPSRDARRCFVERIKKRYGDLAAQALIEGLHKVAKERQG